ncbi:MAG: amidohydrolase [Deltaproteobacteria bacterium]|nr:amidohydrolase [Deltaproteobacteria bacterium]
MGDESDTGEGHEGGLTFSPDWLSREAEPPIAPGRLAIDPHFHFFEQSNFFPRFMPEMLREDTRDHAITHAVFVQCRENIRQDGPEHLRPVGETEWVDALAARMRDSRGVQVGAIVGDAWLSHGAKIGETLDAHAEASSLFRGIRDMGIWDASEDVESIEHATGPDLYGSRAFREGFTELARRDLSFDAYQYHTQLFSVEALARSFPDTRIVIDHLGTPIGTGPYAGKRKAVFEDWSRAMSSIADCQNVFVKLGGMAMPWSGFGWGEREHPPSSDEFVATYMPYYRHAIETFGPNRCMFESNFPVDRLSLPYTTLWNAFEKLAADYSETEQEALFRGTAAQVYRIATDAD